MFCVTQNFATKVLRHFCIHSFMRTIIPR